MNLLSANVEFLDCIIICVDENDNREGKREREREREQVYYWSITWSVSRKPHTHNSPTTQWKQVDDTRASPTCLRCRRARRILPEYVFGGQHSTEELEHFSHAESCYIFPSFLPKFIAPPPRTVTSLSSLSSTSSRSPKFSWNSFVSRSCRRILSASARRALFPLETRSQQILLTGMISRIRRVGLRWRTYREDAQSPVTRGTTRVPNAPVISLSFVGHAKLKHKRPWLHHFFFLPSFLPSFLLFLR